MTTRPAALITGGAVRIGLHFSEVVAQLGYDVAIHFNSSEQAAARAVDKIRRIGVACQAFQFDFSSSDDPAALIDQASSSFPNLSLLVNCASVYNAAPIAATSMPMLQREFQVNLFAPFILCGAFANLAKTGNIVNILDNKIAFQQYHYGAYLLSKKALADLTRMAAMEFAPRVRVNGIAPGVILPGSTRTDDYIAWRARGIPLRRKGNVEELGKALTYLLDNEFVTGQVLVVDGGEGLHHIGQNAESYSSEKDS